MKLLIPLLSLAVVAHSLHAQTQGYQWTNYVGSPGGIGNADGTGSNARFWAPTGISADNSGNIYVADQNNSTIREINASTGAVTTFVGSAGHSGTTNGTGSAARFFNPQGALWDPTSGFVYILDRSNEQVRVATPAGAVSVLAGGLQQTGTADGTGTAARFNNPQAFALDGSGNLYVADTGNHTIRKVTPAGVVTTFAGTPGVSGTTDGLANAAQFNSPEGIAVDAMGNIWVADTGNQTIREITSGGTVSTVAGLAGSSGSANGTGSAARFSTPMGLIVANGNIIVVDKGNATIRQVTPAGVVTTLAGTAGSRSGADGTGAAARFWDPQAITVDASGNFYIADSTNSTVRKMTSANVVTTLAGLAVNRGTTNGTGAGALFFSPDGAVLDSSGNLFVADTVNHTIRKVAPGGVVTLFAGTASSSGSTDGTGTAARFNSPSGLAIDGSNNLYVADTGNHTIRMITSAAVVTTLAGTAGSSGSTDGTGSAARFKSPNAVALDASGNIYVSDTSNNTVRKIASGNVVTTVAGTAGSTGTTNGTGTAARFNAPSGLTVGPDGNIYIADSNNHTIRMMTPAGVVTTFAGAAGTSGSADGNASSTARFWNPRDVHFDSAGYLYIVDQSNQMMRKLSPGGNVVTIGGLPTVASSGDGFGATALFSGPRRIAVAGNGQLYLVDQNNNRISVGTPQAPLLQTLAPTAVSTTSATINATLCPNGTPTTAQLKYGLTPSYGTTVLITLTPNDDVTTHSVAVLLTGLTGATTYHYSITSTNSAGTATGSDSTFTTLNAPEIRVEEPAGTPLTPGASTVSYGSSTAGVVSGADTFTVRSIGIGSLTGLSVTVDGANPGDFSVDASALPGTLASGNGATFTVTFTPLGDGGRTATLHVLSNDPAKPSFDIALAGNGQVVNGTWNTGTDVPLTVSSFSAVGTVNLTLNFAPPNGTNLTLVSNTGGAPINGTFTNLAQGQAVGLTYNGTIYNFVADYFGGDGNDLVLEVPGLTQSSSLVESLTSLDVPRIQNGLGWNVTLTNQWEFAKVQAAGGKEARIQFGWSTVENMSGTLALTTQFKNALSYCVTYNLQPLIVAAYGPPYQNIMTLTVTGNTPAGSYSIPVTPVSGQLSTITPPYCHVYEKNGTQIVATGKWGYYGAIIDSVNTGANTITLGSATTVALTAGTQLTVNQLLYPSVATGNATDPSLVAYARYVRFLASQIAAYGLTGRVEIWNEPPWTNDPWDHRGGFYDTVPNGITNTSPNWGMLGVLLNDTPPAGVHYTWGGSHKSGFCDILEMPAPGATQAQVATAVPSGGWHPYGNTPEDHAWYPDQLLTASNVFTTQLVGTNSTSNVKYDRKVAANNLLNYGWTATQQVSEDGLNTSNEMLKARYNMRSFLVMMSLGPAPQLDRMNFYRLADTAGGYGFVDITTQTELQSYTAMKGFMSDVNAIGNAPVTYTAADLPNVTAPYSGYFPLTTIPVVGRAHAGDTQNSFLFVAYQRSYGAVWTAVTSPTAVPITVNIPAGRAAVTAWDLVTRQPVPVTTGNGTATYSVADNPVALQILPVTDIAPATLAYASNPAVYTVGTAITGNVPSNSGGLATTYSVSPPLPAGLTLDSASGIISGTPTSFSATGNYTITASNNGGSTTVSINITVQETIGNWRQTWFGSTANTGNAANSADPYHIGVSNAEVFAFLGPGQDPSKASPVLLPQLQESGGNLFYSFAQPPGVSGVTYSAEWSATLQNDWQPVADIGSGTQHIFSIPMGGHAKLFLRLKVTAQ